MSQAIARAGTEFVTGTNSVPKIEQNPKTRFQAAILPFPIKFIEKIADVSPETVKAWRAGRQMPQVEHMYRLAAMIDSVRELVLYEIGAKPPRAVSAIVSGLQQVAMQGGEEAAAARALLRGMGV